MSHSSPLFYCGSSSVHEAARSIVVCRDLGEKLKPLVDEKGARLEDKPAERELYWEPGRDPAHRLIDKGERLPSAKNLTNPEVKALYFERFAHHELMAVELFAWALLAFPDAPKALRRGWVKVLEDEQRHCRLYLERIDELGGTFGGDGLPDYFWRKVPTSRTGVGGVKAFLAAMGLTFEQANLDFSAGLIQKFKSMGDERSASVVQVVHDDEVTHVALASHWLQLLSEGEALKSAYEECLPFPLFPAKARGRSFQVEPRRRAGLSDTYIDWIRNVPAWREEDFDAGIRKNKRLASKGFER